jgi:hypothetical protein
MFSFIPGNARGAGWAAAPPVRIKFPWCTGKTKFRCSHKTDMAIYTSMPLSSVARNSTKHYEWDVGREAAFGRVAGRASGGWEAGQVAGQGTVGVGRHAGEIWNI